MGCGTSSPAVDPPIEAGGPQAPAASAPSPASRAAPEPPAAAPSPAQAAAAAKAEEEAVQRRREEQRAFRERLRAEKERQSAAEQRKSEVRNARELKEAHEEERLERMHKEAAASRQSNRQRTSGAGEARDSTTSMCSNGGATGTDAAASALESRNSASKTQTAPSLKMPLAPEVPDDGLGGGDDDDKMGSEYHAPSEGVIRRLSRRLSAGSSGISQTLWDPAAKPARSAFRGSRNSSGRRSSARTPSMTVLFAEEEAAAPNDRIIRASKSGGNENLRVSWSLGDG